MPKATDHSKLPAPSPSSTASTALTVLTDGMRNAVANCDPTEEPRALPIMQEVPPGHFMFQIERDCHEPHLHDGEWVVVDSNDRSITFGELYFVMQSNGPHLWQINRFKHKLSSQSAEDRPVAMLSPLNKMRWLPDGTIDTTGPLFLSDGPIYIDCLERDILGRVVGLIDPRERFDRRQREAIHARVERDRAQEARRKRNIGS